MKRFRWNNPCWHDAWVKLKNEKKFQWAQWSYTSLFSCIRFLCCRCWQQIFAFSVHERNMSGIRIGMCSVMWCIQVVNTRNTWAYLITCPHALTHLSNYHPLNTSSKHTRKEDTFCKVQRTFCGSLQLRKLSNFTLKLYKAASYRPEIFKLCFTVTEGGAME